MAEQPSTNTGRWPTVPAMIVSAAERFGDVTAIVDGDRTLTFGELVQAAETFGAALCTRIEPGERVAIWAHNCLEWVVAFLGLSQAGAVLIPISTRFKGHEASHMLSKGKVRALVTVNGFLGNDYLQLLGDRSHLPDLRTIIVARGDVPQGAIGWDEFISCATPGLIDELRQRRQARKSDDPSDILFTSGTTGVPKGVVMTQSATLRVATDWTDMVGLRFGDRYLMVNPYFHMFGLKSGILSSLSVGATMYPEPVFDVQRVLERVQSERITALPATPTVYQSILDYPDREKYDISTLRFAVTGGADIPVELIRRMREDLHFEAIFAGYGLTEGGTVASTVPGDPIEVIVHTVGWLRPSYEVRIVDASGIDVPAGQSGEVLVRGGSVMSHYLDDPEATAQVLSGDGWLRTGDLGRYDESGRLLIVGRLKDMFIVGGFNAYPPEIENALLRHPDVLRAAVIGIPDHRLGEVGMAFIILRPGASTTAEEIIAWSREEMANFKVPRVVELVEALPLNASGKVMKDVLRDQVAGTLPI